MTMYVAWWTKNFQVVQNLSPPHYFTPYNNTTNRFKVAMGYMVVIFIHMEDN
jgi:hypothetical protein